MACNLWAHNSDFSCFLLYKGPDPYVQTTNYCFYATGSAMTHSEAVTYCSQKSGGYLAEPSSLSKQDALMAYLGKTSIGKLVSLVSIKCTIHYLLVELFLFTINRLKHQCLVRTKSQYLISVPLNTYYCYELSHWLVCNKWQ